MTGPAASVVIPAHDEVANIGRTLTTLRKGLSGEVDVIVVCNGCRDDTAEVARGAGARVLEIPEPSKASAVRAGNTAAEVFPRIHLDADVELSGSSLEALLEALAEPGVLAAAPRRVVPRTGCPLLVRWYYDVWEELPQVREGLFGRGVMALSRAGQERVDALPVVMSDDLAVSDAFGPGETRIVADAAAVVRPPRTVRDLLRRRARVATGNAQASRLGVRRPESATTWATLGALVRRRPTLLPRVAVFLALGVASRLKARQAIRTGDFTTWQRDESSRSTAAA